MKTFVVGFLNFFDNEILMEKVQAQSKLEAVRKCSFLEGYDIEDNTTVEDIDYMLSSCDATISVIEV